MKSTVNTKASRLLFTQNRPRKKMPFVGGAGTYEGRNGEGKSTLSKIIMQMTDYLGVCKIGHNVKTGYFAQNQDEFTDVL